MARGKRQNWNTRVSELIEARRAAGGTVAGLADTLGVSRSTIYNWLQREDRPSTAFGELGDKFTRQERYYFRERPQRVAPEPGLLPGTLAPGISARNLLTHPEFAFDFRPSRAAEFGHPALQEAFDRGETLTYQLVIQRGVFGERQLVDFDLPRGSMPAQLYDKRYYDAVRHALRQAGGGVPANLRDDSYEAVSVELEAVFLVNGAAAIAA